MNRLWFSLVLIAMLGLCYGCKKSSPEPAEEKPKYEFRYDADLEVIGSDGRVKTTFQIEIAEGEQAVMQGLKYREIMAQNQGMLFIFGVPDRYDFWMQDTYLPLDMLFIGADKTIFQIHEDAQPFSEERISPSQIHKYVLELNAGICKKLKIQTGDKISWKLKQ